MTQTSKPSDILDRMRQTATRAKPIQQPSSENASVAEEKKVRFTLDLNKSQHKFLKLFALELETDASVVVRALLKHLESDPQLADSIQLELTN